MCDWDICMACAQEAEEGPGTPGLSLQVPKAPTHTPAVAGGLPEMIPCGRCRACSDPTFSAAKRSNLQHGCGGCCREWLGAEGRDDWCDNCRGKQQAILCKKRAKLPIRAAGEVAVVSGGDEQGGGGDEQGGRGGGGGGGATGGARRAPEVLLASYIERHELDRHEVAIAEDPSVCVVVATISALSADTEHGDLLIHTLGRRGILDLYFDEAHCLWDRSTASYSESLASYRQWFERMCAQLRRHGHGRPRVAGFTSTLPPPCKRAVALALGMSAGAACIRCTVDRPELRFVRLLQPQMHGEKEFEWIQGVLRCLVSTAPTWALAGSIVVYCSTARVARRASATVRMLRPGGVAAFRTERPNIT